MFERFTAQARAAVVDAQSCARRRSARKIGAIHLFEALADSSMPTAALLTTLGADSQRLKGALHEIVPEPVSDDVALRALGIELDEIRRRVEATFGPDALDRAAARSDRRRRWPWNRSSYQHIPFTDGAKKSLELALREAIRLGDRTIMPEHLLLGVVRADDRRVMSLLDRLELSTGTLRAAVEASLRRSA